MSFIPKSHSWLLECTETSQSLVRSSWHFHAACDLAEMQRALTSPTPVVILVLFKHWKETVQTEKKTVQFHTVFQLQHTWGRLLNPFLSVSISSSSRGVQTVSDMDAFLLLNWELASHLGLMTISSTSFVYLYLVCLVQLISTLTLNSALLFFLSLTWRCFQKKTHINHPQTGNLCIIHHYFIQLYLMIKTTSQILRWRDSGNPFSWILCLNPKKGKLFASHWQQTPGFVFLLVVCIYLVFLYVLLLTTWHIYVFLKQI